MEIKDLLQQHGNETYRFSDKFSDSVMFEVEKLHTGTIVIAMWQRNLIRIAAACIIIVSGALFALEGSVSVDAILGISSYDDSDISISESVYEVWNEIEIN